MKVTEVYKINKVVRQRGADKQKTSDADDDVFKSLEQARKKMRFIARLESEFEWQRYVADNSITFIKPDDWIVSYIIVPCILIESSDDED